MEFEDVLNALKTDKLPQDFDPNTHIVAQMMSYIMNAPHVMRRDAKMWEKEDFFPYEKCLEYQLKTWVKEAVEQKCKNVEIKPTRYTDNSSNPLIFNVFKDNELFANIECHSYEKNSTPMSSSIYDEKIKHIFKDTYGDVIITFSNRYIVKEIEKY